MHNSGQVKIIMKAEILKMLREADRYVSGQQICEKFGVSRTAVWKVIRQLQEEGYQVEAVRNRGYHIVTEPDADPVGRAEYRLLSGDRFHQSEDPAAGR